MDLFQFVLQVFQFRHDFILTSNYRSRLKYRNVQNRRGALMYRTLLAGMLFLLITIFAHGQDLYAPDTAEPGSVESIRENTTDAKYLGHWVNYVPESSSVPSPTDFLGHIAGARGELVR